MAGSLVFTLWAMEMTADRDILSILLNPPDKALERYVIPSLHVWKLRHGEGAAHSGQSGLKLESLRPGRLGV